MPPFKLDSVYSPTADQPAAIEKIAAAVEAGARGVTLLGATGTGKTMTMAATIEKMQRPALILAHNKTLAAQLCNEFRTYFPSNAVEYFVSYYDYYQPEAYVPSKDLYIEKDSAINQEIDRLRHAATAALFARRDVVIVASVSAIFGLGSPETYNDNCQILLKGGDVDRDELLRKLVYLQYNRNDTALGRGTFRVRGDTLEVFPAYAETAFRALMFGDEVERLQHFDPLTGELIVDDLEHVAIWPATHYNVKEGTMERAVAEIGRELNARTQELEAEGKLLESHRLRQRTQYDMEMLREVGFCSGIENYSRILDGRPPGARPYCLIDYFPEDFVCFIDESHQTVPQIGGMYEGDRSRKSTLVDFGFRLPSAMDNRPQTFEEFLSITPQLVFVSATPGAYEREHSVDVVEQIVRPTGIVDPEVEVRETRNQIDDLMGEIRMRVDRNERTLVTTLTKKMSEDLTDYLLEMGFKVRYLHSEIDTLERIQIIRELRLGEYDVLVGVNLLREGLDLPGRRRSAARRRTGSTCRRSRYFMRKIASAGADDREQRHERDAEAALEVGPRAAQHDHADVGDHEREQRADVDQLRDLLERHERGERRDQDAERRGDAHRRAALLGDLREDARQQAVAAHREHDPGLAVEDRQHDAGDRHQRAERDQGRAPVEAERLEHLGERRLLAVEVLVRAARRRRRSRRGCRAACRSRASAMIAIGRSRPGLLDLLARGRDRVEADVGEEDHRRAVTTPSKPSGLNGVRLPESKPVKARTMKRITIATLTIDHHRVGAGALAHADDQQRGDREHEEDGRQVERAAVLAGRVGERRRAARGRTACRAAR